MSAISVPPPPPTPPLNIVGSVSGSPRPATSPPSSTSMVNMTSSNTAGSTSSGSGSHGRGSSMSPQEVLMAHIEPVLTKVCGMHILLHVVIIECCCCWVAGDGFLKSLQT
jgi:hypothetical protein